MQVRLGFEALLDRLAHGDEAAVATAFEEFAPALRGAVDGWLPPRMRARFDTGDIVQSVWGDLILGLREGKWQFDNVDRFRGFLIRAVRNRFLKRLQQNDRAILREHRVGRETSEAATGESPSAAVRVDEMWRQMLEQLPPVHRELLELKRQGLTLDELAKHSGLHPSSIRRIFADLAHRLDLRPRA